MSKIHYAAIDVGSNAVRLLIKCINAPEAEEHTSKVQLIRVPIRLGEDAFVKGRIGSKKRKQLLSLMAAYKEMMDIYDVERYRACATSAMRDASNGEELIHTIRKETGINIEIISGRQEAELISSNLIEGKTLDSNAHYLYVDVGGGSTELNILQGNKLLHSQSFNIGTVRRLSGKVSEQEDLDFITYLSSIAKEYPKIHIVGSGGNINKLLRLGAPSQRANVNYLPIESLKHVAQELKQYTPEERMIHFRLKPDRADVIVPAAEIFIRVGEILSAEGIIVPTKGLSDGIIEQLCRTHAPT